MQEALAAGNVAGLGVAFLAGMIAFLSPCILPVIPAYLSYFSGVSVDELSRNSESRSARRALLWNALLFIVGFLIVFVSLGVAFGAVGQFLVVNRETFLRFGGILLILFGLYLLELLPIPALYRTAKFQVTGNSRFQIARSLQSFLTGLAFGFAWTPCIGPILGTILFYATWAGGSTQGFVLLLSFALGLGVPFFLSAVALQFALPLLKRSASMLQTVQRVAAGVLLFTGALIVVGLFDDVLGLVIGGWTLPI